MDCLDNSKPRLLAGLCFVMSDRFIIYRRDYLN